MPHVSLERAVETLSRQGVIRPEVAEHLSPCDRQVQVPSLEDCYDDPTLVGILIDESVSMGSYQAAVIGGQRDMLRALRGSAECRQDSLYVAHWLFHHELTLLQPFTVLKPEGGDGVVELDASSYDPEHGGGTALYKAVHRVLEDMAAAVSYAISQAVRATFSIAIITDGQDNHGAEKAEVVRNLVRALSEKGYLRNSMVIGIEGYGFTLEVLERIRQDLGFSSQAMVQGTDGDIRRAFALASQSVIRGRELPGSET